MTTPNDPHDALSRRALRFVDGASQPVLVEELYVDWDLGVNYAYAFQGTRSRVAGWWPKQGAAWEKFGDVILEHIEAGRIVMCSNSDDPDHPEYHLTQGHSRWPFIWGERPLLLRHLATPAGSTAWRKRLAAQASVERRKVEQAAAADEKRAEYLALVADRVLMAAAGGAVTVRAMSAATGFGKDDVQSAVHALVADGRLVYDGRRGFGGHRWRPASGG